MLKPSTYGHNIMVSTVDYINRISFLHKMRTDLVSRPLIRAQNFENPFNFDFYNN